MSSLLVKPHVAGHLAALTTRHLRTEDPCHHYSPSSHQEHQPAREPWARRAFKQPAPYQLSVLRKQLNQNPEIVVRILQLAENESLSNEEFIRLGSRGSLCVTREQSERAAQGVWYNFETNESGDMMDLIRQYKHFSRASDLQNYVVSEVLPQLNNCHNINKREERSEAVNQRQAETKAKVEAYVAKIISELKPIEGTVAEKYLRTVRKIQNLPETKSLRYHPSLSTKAKDGSWLNGVPGLVALASHPDTDTGNVQVTYLDPVTCGKHQEAELARRTLGSFTGSGGQHHYCQIADNTQGRRQYSFVCEGVETALSVHQAFPDTHLVASLGKNNLARLDPGVLNDKVVLIMDNDNVPVTRDKVFHATTIRLASHGKQVYYVMPPLLVDRDKTDMNDVLVANGVEAVYDVIINGLIKVRL